MSDQKIYEASLCSNPHFSSLEKNMKLSRFLSACVPCVKRNVFNIKSVAYNGNGIVEQRNTGAGERAMKAVRRK